MFEGVVRPAFHRSEQRFGVGVVVGDPWPGERPEHVQIFQAFSNIAARMAVRLSASGISGSFRPLLIHSRDQALLTGSAAMAGSTPLATSQARCTGEEEQDHHRNKDKAHESALAL